MPGTPSQSDHSIVTTLTSCHQRNQFELKYILSQVQNCISRARYKIEYFERGTKSNISSQVQNPYHLVAIQGTFTSCLPLLHSRPKIFSIKCSKGKGGGSYAFRTILKKLQDWLSKIGKVGHPLTCDS